MNQLNGLLEDLGAAIGYTATTTLVIWFGGTNLYVPLIADEQHGLAKLIGFPAFRRLVENFQGETLWIPADDRRGNNLARDRAIAEMIAKGMGSKEIARETGLTERRVQQLRAEIEKAGLIPLVLKAQRKVPGKSRRQDAG